MLKGLRKLFTPKQTLVSTFERWNIESQDLIWALGSLCALHRVPFDVQLILKQFPPPYTTDTLIQTARELGFKIKPTQLSLEELSDLTSPCLVMVKPKETQETAADDVSKQEPLEQQGLEEENASENLNEHNNEQADSEEPIQLEDGCFVLLTKVTAEKVIIFESNTNAPTEITAEEFNHRYLGCTYLIAKQTEKAEDPDALDKEKAFGFSWFTPELLKHKKIWRDVLLASLIIQLLALGTPLFTQAIIDKVIVHRTESTLMVIAFAMAVFMIFSTLLTWIRQYLVLHTGNRVDAVLASEVFNHLFKLPPRYFEHRPTGVISARLQGVETIREFIAGAAVTLILDMPFLFIFIAIMFWYSVTLTLIALGILAVITGISIAIAPLYQKQLNEQFVLGARNQAFVTEYVAGVETVKSLQMEPQLRDRYSDYLADYLRATFKTRQLSNTYSVSSTGLEQLMTLLILTIGAYTVMTNPEFTIGMLVAFQMFAGRLSQPMMRLVGLWQQFQQASLSVKRLGDLMNAPAEPYSLTPSRMREGKGLIQIDGLSFRHNETLPFLYTDFKLEVKPGAVVAIMGPSGSGKSSLVKLLQGFYQATSGRIRIDGIDVQNLSANELRHYFGVVPQETVLFSGSIYENLLAANPHSSFEQVVESCKQAEIHDFIEALPNGYQTMLGERGAGLSGGQRQRIAIARALLKRPKILIFDEATSNLDQETAAHFVATANQFRGKISMIFITHDLPKNLHVDEVVRIGDNQASVLEVTQSNIKQPNKQNQETNPEQPK